VTIDPLTLAGWSIPWGSSRPDPFALTIDPWACSPDDSLLSPETFDAKIDAVLAEWAAIQQKEAQS